jgi:hypothetical protein
MVQSLNLSIEAGYQSMKTYNSLAACKFWLAGWSIVRQLARPNIKIRAGARNLPTWLRNHTYCERIAGR